MYAKKIFYTAATAPVLGKPLLFSYTFCKFSCTRLPNTRAGKQTKRIGKLSDASSFCPRSPRTSLLLIKASMFGMARTWTNSKMSGR